MAHGLQPCNWEHCAWHERSSQQGQCAEMIKECLQCKGVTCGPDKGPRQNLNYLRKWVLTALTAAHFPGNITHPSLLRFRSGSGPNWVHQGSCYDPARDRRAIAQIEGTRDIRDREADYLPSPRVNVRDKKGSRTKTVV